jgi:methionine sulfoxide reductase catalytic subunit
MLIARKADIPTSEITDEAVYTNRREFLKSAGFGMAVLGGLLPGGGPLGLPVAGDGDKLTPYDDVTGYNNYYEFGTDKEDPARNAGRFRTTPWTVEIAGEVARPARYGLEDLLKGLTPEERVYRHRCVEAWSMVVPWRGIPLVKLIDRLGPTSRASTSNSPPCSIRGRCPGSSEPFSTGPMSRPCGWTRRGTR